MSGPSSCSIYIGNLDERVSDRVLYDILIQAGRVVDLHIPRDRETDKPKGYAFAEYETEEIADYAVKLFSGLVTLYNRTLKFAISGQDKLAQNNFNGVVPLPNSSSRQRPSHPVPINNLEIPNHSMRSAPSRVSAYPANDSLAPPGVTNLSNGYGSNSNGNSNDSDRRLFGSAVNAISRSRSRWYDTSNPMPYSY
ncbi:PREDICTED: protein HSH49 [Populus euphratica]|uniref:Protein HSH49 n=1 Tax=Populus euphratica TaxID=75702 RepID=A0AAJ6X405_POPEU|nr:PREDICTED: protein HSH49 [Populus euphratica]